MAKAKIFINYSRNDSAGSAGRLKDSLESEFGNKIFQDVDDIHIGEKFSKVIDKSIKDCEIFLAVIGRTWANQRNKNGELILYKNENYVRIEIETAFKYKKKIIPILVDNAKMPKSNELPDSISELVEIHASTLRHENWKNDVSKLCKQLSEILEEIEKKANEQERKKRKEQTELTRDQGILKLFSQPVISENTSRKYIGTLGILFPIILIISSSIGGNFNQIQNSIRAYYHTNIRDIYVAYFCITACFLFFYRGYARIDNIIGNMGGIFAFGLAFFHYDPEHNIDLFGSIESVSFASFFLLQAYFSLSIFTKSDITRSLSKYKVQRNRVYRINGYIMLLSLLFIVLYNILLQSYLEEYNPVFWFECIALWAYGLSWLIKGGVFLKKDIRIERIK